MHKHNIRQFFNSQLGRKQLGYILLFSSLITLVGTSIQLLIDYQIEYKQVEIRIEEFKQGYLEALSSSLWKLDDE